MHEFQTSRLNQLSTSVGWLYFSSGPVRSMVTHSLPARFEILIVRARVCMTVLFQCKLWLCRVFSFYTVQSLAQDRKRGLCQLSGVDVHVYTSRSVRLLFRLWQRCGPQRSPLVQNQTKFCVKRMRSTIESPLISTNLVTVLCVGQVNIFAHPMLLMQSCTLYQAFRLHASHLYVCMHACLCVKK